MRRWLRHWGRRALGCHRDQIARRMAEGMLSPRSSKG